MQPNTNHKINVSSAGQFMKQHVVSVFETMLSLRVSPSVRTELPGCAERITGTAGFGGENLNGVLYLHLSTAAANRLASAMLQMKPEEISSENEVNDVIGEVTNMLAGGFKSWLTDSGAPCALSTPTIIRGTSYVLETSSDIERRQFIFESDAGVMAVEIHIRFE